MDKKDIDNVEKQVNELDKRINQVESHMKSIESQKENAVVNHTSHYPVGGRSDSDEQRALKFFGCKNAGELIRVNTCHPKFSGVPTELKFLVKQLKEDIDISRMMQQMFHGEPVDRDTMDVNNPLSGLARVKGMLDGNYYGREILAPRLKTFSSTGATAGDEWVPTAISNQYIEEHELARRVLELPKKIIMPSQPFDLPVQGGVTTARIIGENATITDTNFTTGKITLTSTKLAEYMICPEELNEDSAPQILALIREEVGVRAQGRAYETGIVNGDNTAPHMDADVLAASDARKAWKGLRKLALANSANGSVVNFGGVASTQTLARSLRTALGKFGVNPMELAFIVSPKVYNQMLTYTDVTTLEKFGNDAVVKRGSLAQLDGIDILISEFVRDDVAATGVNTGVALDDIYSTMLLVNKQRFYWGVRRPIRVRAVVDPTPPNDRWLVCSWSRVDFQGHAQSATEVSVVIGRNIA